MQKKISTRLLKEFNISSTCIFNSETMGIFQKDIEGAIEEKQLLCVVCGPCARKTILISRVKDYFGSKVKFIYVQNSHKESIGPGHVMEAIFLDLKIGERAPKSLEARTRMFIRIIGEHYVSTQQLICIVLEEGHRLNSDLFRTLKEMRESLWKFKFNSKKIHLGRS